MNALRYGLVTGAALCLWAGLAAAQQQPLTGVYAKQGGTLVVLEGDGQTLVQYESTFPQGQSMGACECTFAVQKKTSPKSWALTTFQSQGKWTLDLEPNKLVLKGPGTDCCGAGWSGQDSFSRPFTRALSACTVKAKEARLQPLDGTRQGPTVVGGDRVEAHAASPLPDVVPVRVVKGAQAVTGLLPGGELECGTQAAGVDAASSGALKALAGKWLQVSRKGKGYLIEEWCGANTPSVTVDAAGSILIDFGQDDLTGQVKSVKSEARGGSTLQVAYPSGASETLTWTVTDAKRNVMRVQGGKDYFRAGYFYVRDDARKGIPVKAEVCEEEE
ncbi:hypothetical protein [Myxococcus sp. AS-1-15]|uniref:hypothetical protein n=1 Tax=Myxococcus sp. AS-1-15 TaxID=2874600 RepID=UPI001CC1A0D9|nr:hypothetical protein [Myxococcus sp. AS-1-15]MBZ4396664.1 hypothetical protein [Myxococcus sp. AS-1-15]